MATLGLFLIGIQVLASLAGHPPKSVKTLPSNQFLAPGCNSSVIKRTAELALDWINLDRREGYVLGLQRIFDAHELPQGPSGSVFYLTLDVLETKCHVLSGKPWKNCQARPVHKTVYGQCKTTVYANKTGDVSHLYNYDCLLRPISARDIMRMCPDCPVPGDPSETRFVETAIESLAKFNAENNHVHYFALGNVTKASAQWVIGPANFVEYTVQETSCSKSKGASDISKCPLLPPENATTGLCEGSVVTSRIDNEKFVTARCELYPPLSSVTDQEHQQPGQSDQHKDESHEDDRHRHHHHHRHRGRGRHGRHRHRKPHHKHHHGKHHHKHDHGEHHRNHSDEHQIPSELEEPVGRVIVLQPSDTHVSLHSLPEIGSEQLDGKPVAPVEKQPKSTPNLPDIHGGPQDRTGSHSSSTKPPRPGIPTFPNIFSESDSCPGEIRERINGLELPKRPAVKLPLADAASPKH